MLLLLLAGSTPPPPTGEALELNDVFFGAGLALGPVYNVGGAPAISSVTPGETSVTFTYTGAATHRRVYLFGGSPGAWVSMGASPVTVTGLTNNTEYQLEISADGSTVADSEVFGTLNPGSGGGGFATPIDGAVALAAASGLQAAIAAPSLILGGVGAAAATGLPAGITLPTAIVGGVGAAAASGLPASLAVGAAVAGSVGQAVASGLQAAISLGSNVTVAGGVGLGAASGPQALVAPRTAIAGGVGVAAASGLQAAITLAAGGGIAAQVGVATASGLSALINVAGPAGLRGFTSNRSTGSRPANVSSGRRPTNLAEV